MKQKLYGNTITPACEICANGRRSCDQTVVLCPIKGVVDLGHRCRKFVYDPLRRLPFRQPDLLTHTEEEFKL